VSWEPAAPIGFSPCGIAFGAVRKTYSAPAKFFVDDNPGANRIFWYWVPDDTPHYEGWTVFHPRVDTPPNEATSTHEREGLGREIRTFDDGDTFTQVLPLHGVHGDASDFAGTSNKNKYDRTPYPPYQPCGLPRMHRAGIQFGGTTSVVAGQAVAGVQFGGASVQVVETLTAGLQRAGKVVAPAPEVLAAGLQLAAKAVALEPQTLAAGVKFGAQSSDVVVTIEELPAGLLFAGKAVDAVDFEDPLAAGVAFGAVSEGVLEAPLPAGVQFGAEIVDVVEVLEAGVQFGGESVDEEEEIVPGATCETAAEVEDEGEFDGAFVGSGDHWFRFPVADGVEYHVKLTLLTGTFVIVFVNEGASCSSTTPIGTIFFASGCVDANAGDDSFWMINVKGIDITYHLEWGPGACP